MTDDPAQVMEVIEGFVTEINGQRFVGVKGRTRVAASHPVVRKFPHLFVPVEPMLRYGDEAMTANPGEKRERPRGRSTAEHPETVRS